MTRLFVCALVAIALLISPQGVDATPGEGTGPSIIQVNDHYNPLLNVWTNGEYGLPVQAVPSSDPMVQNGPGSSRGDITVVKSFNFPAGWLYARDAAWDGSALWIGENFNSRIYKLDPSTGQVMTSFYAPDSNPWGLAWEGVNLINATITLYHMPPGDTLPDYVYTLTTSGGKLNSWLAPKSPDATPHGCAFDQAKGVLWLSDGYYDTIYELDPQNGNIISSFTFPGAEPRGLAWDGTHLWAIDNPGLVLYKLDTAGTVVDTFDISSLGSDPEGLTYDGKYFWVTENATDKIYQIDTGSDPMPDIKVDGQDGPINVPSSQTVSMTISLDPGSQNGVAHDWWVLGRRNSATLFSWTPAGWRKGLVRAYNGQLMPVSNYVVHNGTIPVGSYIFAFAVDGLDNVYQGTFIDTISVTSY